MNRLHVTKLTSIGAVDAGDNPAARILLFKRDVSSDERERLADRGAAMPDGSYPIATVADLRNAVQAFGRASNKEAVKRHIVRRARALNATDALPEGWGVAKIQDKNAESVETTIKEDPTMGFDLDSLDLEADVRKALDDHIATVVKDAVSAATDTTPPDPLEKADPQVRSLIEKAEREAAELRKSLDVEIAKRRAAEFTDIAKQLAPVTGNIDDAAANLAALEAGAPEAFGWLRKQLEAAKTAVVEAGLFKTIGSDEGEPDAVAKVQAMATELRKANPNLTAAQAQAQVYRDNPDLVDAVRSNS